MPELSVIILSYNTKDITLNCISSLIDALSKADKDKSYELIVIDNASSDGSGKAISNIERMINFENIRFKTILSEVNLGYPKGNNLALKNANGKYTLFLNSDVIVGSLDFDKLIGYLENHSEVGVITPKVMLNKQQIDPASHRGFPTLWNSFCYFTKLEKITRKIPVLAKVFGGYHLVYKNLSSVHEIDSPTGAFYFTRKEILDKTKGFDEEFFMYGEDLDLSYKIKSLGYKIVFHPDFSVIHLKYSSGLKRNNNQENITRNHFFEAMKIFYKKHYEKKYPDFVNNFVYLMINLRKKLR